MFAAKLLGQVLKNGNYYRECLFQQIEGELEGDMRKLPVATQIIMEKCQSAINHLSTCQSTPSQGQLGYKEYCIEFIHELLRDLRSEQKLFSETVNQCADSAHFAESLTADILHIVSSSKKVSCFPPIFPTFAGSGTKTRNKLIKFRFKLTDYGIQFFFKFEFL